MRQALANLTAKVELLENQNRSWTPGPTFRRPSETPPTSYGDDDRIFLKQSPLPVAHGPLGDS